MPSPDLSALCAIAVMAKAPRPGQVKTRLQGVLSPAEAAGMGAAFLRDITANLAIAAASAPLHGFVAFAPAGGESTFDGLLAPGTRMVLADGSGEMPAGVEGFGRSLVHAMDGLFALGYGAAGVLNADSPTLPTEYLRRAAHALVGGQPAVFGPAEDGGYYFLGLRARDPRPFSRIAWSTNTVADETRARLREAGLDTHELPPWYDVDDPPALARLLTELGRAGPDAPFAASATEDYIAELGLAQRLRAA